MKYSPLDLALQNVVPVLAVPLHGTFEPLVNIGQRFLVGGDGLYIEVRRAWLHAVWPIAHESRVAKPFGVVQRCVRMEFGAIPGWIKERFASDAIASGNMEIAACIVWNSFTQTLDYRRCIALNASSHRIEYVRPSLASYESLVLDLHSHGHGRAFFSATDNEDDRNEVKIAGVVGNVNGELSWKFRLCLAGIFINESDKHSQQYDLCHGDVSNA